MSLLQAVSPHDVVARVKAKARALRKSHSTVAAATEATTTETTAATTVATDEQCVHDSTTTLQDTTIHNDAVGNDTTTTAAASTSGCSDSSGNQQHEQGTQLQRLRRESLQQLEKPLWFGLALLTQTKEQHLAGTTQEIYV
jgi:hypothetical protein